MEASRREQLSGLLAEVGLGAADPELFDVALTHRSHANEVGVRSNERLEFLGDAVVGLSVAEALYKRHPRLSEGGLAKRRAYIISANTLAEQAKRLNLGQYILLGKSEEKSGGRERQSILADVFEALVGAIFLSCGWDTAHQWVIRQLEPLIASAGSNQGDYKTALQEILQAEGRGIPQYRLVNQEGPDHARLFTVGALVEGRMLGAGSGRSKKTAEQEAARVTLECLKKSR